MPSEICKIDLFINDKQLSILAKILYEKGENRKGGKLFLITGFELVAIPASLLHEMNENLQREI